MPSKLFAVALSFGSIIAVALTLFVFVRFQYDDPHNQNLISVLLMVDLAFLLVLVAYISWRLVKLSLARKAGSVGSRMQTRIITMFSIVSMIPTIIMAVFSLLFFNQGIQTWFNQKIDTALDASVAAAEGYMREHENNIRNDAFAIANILDSYSKAKPALLQTIIKAQVNTRGLSRAIMFREDQILANTDSASSAIANDIKYSTPDALLRADNWEVVIWVSYDNKVIRALNKFSYFKDTYLLVERFIDPQIIDFLKSSTNSANEFRSLQTSISGLQIKFLLIYIAVSLLLLLSALWMGFVFAGEMVKPVQILVDATDKVKSGDLTTRVAEGQEGDEMATLGRAFNRMTEQIERHQSELMTVNEQIDERRRFIEVVLRGVSAGVVAFSNDKEITLFNNKALRLLGIEEDNISAKYLRQTLPQLMEMLDFSADNKEDELTQREITIEVADKPITLFVRIVIENLKGKVLGYIMTFDDISDLIKAQKIAAWSGVARRIAHEIKNPLTPIQLATERLQHKFGDAISSDKEQFDRYLSTIARHVDTMRHIVEEFAYFARMPSPVKRDIEIHPIISEVITGQKMVDESIDYQINIEPKDIKISADSDLLQQILINVIKNARESIQESEIINGTIKISFEQNKTHQIINIIDNGKGLHKQTLAHATEPYVTTKEKGTGLGLAIVKRAMDEHGGQFIIDNITDDKDQAKGAKVSLLFP